MHLTALHLSMGELFFEHLVKAGRTVHDAQGDGRSVESSSLEVPEELPPCCRRFLVVALKTEDELRAIVADTDSHEEGNRHSPFLAPKRLDRPLSSTFGLICTGPLVPPALTYR
jgi:hypothetical protein